MRGCSTALAAVAAADDDPAEVAAVPWSHGYGRLVLDQTDYQYAREQGRRLADLIREQATRNPGRRQVVVAHSAGAAVGLAAAESLPPGAIDRLILLAPAVSDRYDLGPAARSAREGIDVFYSRKDVWALGVAMRLVGTTDRGRWSVAAGRTGFRVPAGADWAGAVRQHAWGPDLAATGHDGGHYGAYAPGFARQYLMPMMLGP
jgi:pimeloyl-ACP methyl ester carboxylesterase